MTIVCLRRIVRSAATSRPTTSVLPPGGHGTMARIAKSAMNRLREKGKKVGMIRPISLWPFPKDIFNKLKNKNSKLKILVVEMSYGQMIEDVKLALDCKAPVEFLGRAGGGIPKEEEIIKKVLSL